MPAINIITVDSKNVNIEQNGKPLGSLKFEGFFKSYISATTASNRVYEFKRASFWNDNYIFKQGEENFISVKLLTLGKMLIEDLKTNTQYKLVSRAFFKEKYDLLNDKDDLILHIDIKRGFLVTIKEGVIETTPLFDSVKEQFLIIAASILLIKMRIRRNTAAAV
jgi:hypothetical protein